MEEVFFWVRIQTCLIFLCDGLVFLLKFVEMLSGNTYFRCISKIFPLFTYFLVYQEHFYMKMLT